jgi:hypothetical protein
LELFGSRNGTNVQQTTCSYLYIVLFQMQVEVYNEGCNGFEKSDVVGYLHVDPAEKSYLLTVALMISETVRGGILGERKVKDVSIRFLHKEKIHELYFRNSVSNSLN